VIKKPITFLFTDAHVVEEGFLELLNNMLTIGMVPALFPDEEKDGLTSAIEDEVRKKKLPETKEAKWNYFVAKARDHMHIVLAMSPAGDNLRVRCRNFPGLVSNTSIDWFFAWPEEALTAVANYFLVNEPLEDEVRQPITEHIVMVHLSVQAYSTEYELTYKRRNFSTPKNYLDFISSYANLLSTHRKNIDSLVRRLEGGLTTLAKASEDTEVLSKELAIKNEEIKIKKVLVEDLIADITEKSEIAGKQQIEASEKKKFLDVESVKIAAEEAEATKALEEAIPAFEEAKVALSMVRKEEITEVKALNSPPIVVQLVCTICYYLYPKTKNLGADDWANVKSVLLGDSKLMQELKEYDIEKLKAEPVRRGRNKIAELEKKLDAVGDPKKLQDLIKSASLAASGLFIWVKANLKCYDIHKSVEPKKKKAAEMKKKLAEAEQELAATEASLKELNEKLDILNADRKIKEDELNDLTEKSNLMTKRLNAATKLITGLGSEQKRWTKDMEVMQEDKLKLVGDCLVGSAFLSYCGAFNFLFRDKMVYNHWLKDVRERNIPSKETFLLEDLLTTDVEISKWASEGLPGDELSIQNGILTTSASRWPLCVDPQMQAV
jgi:dynein heavy chain